jgi:hypothetical protein
MGEDEGGEGDEGRVGGSAGERDGEGGVGEWAWEHIIIYAQLCVIPVDWLCLHYIHLVLSTPHANSHRLGYERQTASQYYLPAGTSSRNEFHRMWLSRL